MPTASTLEELRVIASAFDRHDLDTILAYFAEDAVFEAPRGPDAWGRRVTGRAAVRAAFADRFAGVRSGAGADRWRPRG